MIILHPRLPADPRTSKHKPYKCILLTRAKSSNESRAAGSGQLYSEAKPGSTERISCSTKTSNSSTRWLTIDRKNPRPLQRNRGRWTLWWSESDLREERTDCLENLKTSEFHNLLGNTVAQHRWRNSKRNISFSPIHKPNTSLPVVLLKPKNKS